MGGIEEQVRVTGGDQAKRELDDVAAAQERVGDSVEETGKQSERANKKTDDLAQSARKLIANYVGIESVLGLFRGLVDLLEEAVRLQGELAKKASTFAGESRELAGQLGVSEAKGASVLTELRIAGGIENAPAKQLGISADIAFKNAGLGGLLSGTNLETTREVAAFGGARGFGDAEFGSLFSFLQTAGKLNSPEDAKLAISQIVAAANESRASSVGEFVSQAARGLTGQLQAGVAFEDALTQAVQTRQVEETGDLAAQTSVALEQVAIANAEPKFTKEIEDEAERQGLDKRDLDSAQRVRLARDIFAKIDNQDEQDRVARLLTPERFLRLSKAFRRSTLDATSGATAAIDRASLADFRLTVEQGTQGLAFREQQNQAASDLEQYQAGAERFTIASARERAKALVDRDVARGIGRGLGREAEEERYVFALLKDKRDRLAAEGADVSEIDAAIENVGTLLPRIPVLDSLPFGIGGLFESRGYRDSRLDAAASAIDNTRRRQSLDRQAQIQLNVVGTQYNAPDPLNFAPSRRDAND